MGRPGPPRRPDATGEAMTIRTFTVAPLVLDQQTLTVRQAAAVIGCDRTTLHRVIAAGRGPRIFRATPRGRARIWRPHLDEWMAAGGANGLPAATDPEPDHASP